MTSLLVGLGNPGPQYDDTRHNVGFAWADSLADTLGVHGQWKAWGKSLICKTELSGKPLLLAKPQTFMNLSGEAVQALLSFYKIPPTQLAVIADDATLPLGSIRIREQGGHGGHNGLRDIISKLGENFSRIRIGVGLCPPHRDLADFVLGKLSVEDRLVLKNSAKDFPALVETGFDKGWEFAGSRFNRRPEPPR